MVGAAAQRTEPKMNIEIEMSSMMRRPWMSDSLP